MLIVRGQEIHLSGRLNRFEGRRVYDSFMALSECATEEQVRSAENFTHFVRILACYARRKFPDVTYVEVSDAINSSNFTQLIRGLNAAIKKQEGDA
jgi:hypothetical protein